MDLRTLLQTCSPRPFSPTHTNEDSGGTTRTLSPFGQQHNGVVGAMDQAHDGVAIVVPVNDQFAPANAAHKPADGNSRQTWGVLGKRDGEAVEEAWPMAHVA